MTGVTRGRLHFTEVQESHKASGGIYEGGGGKSNGGGKGRWGREVAWDAVDGPTVLKAPTLEKGHTHKNTQRCVHIVNVNFHTDTFCKDAASITDTFRNKAAINRCWR